MPIASQAGSVESGDQQGTARGMERGLLPACEPSPGAGASALAASSAELQAVIAHAREGMHALDPTGRIMWANPAALDFLGYTSGEYVAHFMHEFHTDQAAFTLLWEQLRHGTDVPEIEAWLRCKSGEIKHVLICARPHPASGDVQCIYCFTHDLSERDLLQQQLHDAAKKLAQLDQRKEEFLAMLGHELRNPLAPIVNSLALMALLEPDTPAFLRAREIIERQIAMMVRLVDDLLDASRLTQGKLEMRLEETTLGPVLALALELTQPLIDHFQHRLVVKAPATNTPLYADPTRLAQALANLLNNAAQYTAGGGVITLTVRNLPNAISFAVRDNGSGIAPELLDHAFDLFAQGANRSQPAVAGLGVGLALVRKIIELHGGNVTASSSQAGSEFVVWLPQGDTEPVS